MQNSADRNVSQHPGGSGKCSISTVLHHFVKRKSRAGKGPRRRWPSQIRTCRFPGGWAGGPGQKLICRALRHFVETNQEPEKANAADCQPPWGTTATYVTWESAALAFSVSWLDRNISRTPHCRGLPGGSGKNFYLHRFAPLRREKFRASKGKCGRLPTRRATTAMRALAFSGSWFLATKWCKTVQI